MCTRTLQLRTLNTAILIFATTAPSLLAFQEHPNSRQAESVQVQAGAQKSGGTSTVTEELRRVFLEHHQSPPHSLTVRRSENASAEITLVQNTDQRSRRSADSEHKKPGLLKRLFGRFSSDDLDTDEREPASASTSSSTGQATRQLTPPPIDFNRRSAFNNQSNGNVPAVPTGFERPAAGQGSSDKTSGQYLPPTTADARPVNQPQKEFPSPFSDGEGVEKNFLLDLDSLNTPSQQVAADSLIAIASELSEEASTVIKTDSFQQEGSESGVRSTSVNVKSKVPAANAASGEHTSPASDNDRVFVLEAPSEKQAAIPLLVDDSNEVVASEQIPVPLLPEESEPSPAGVPEAWQVSNSKTSTRLSAEVLSGTPAPVASELDQSRRDEQRFRIASRGGSTGFKGFCPVELRDRRELVDSREEYKARFGLKTYYFSSPEAKQTFESDPTRYAPAAGGSDVVLLVNTGEDIDGSLDFSLWYRDRLYLFRSRETQAIFAKTPDEYANQY